MLPDKAFQSTAPKHLIIADPDAQSVAVTQRFIQEAFPSCLVTQVKCLSDLLMMIEARKIDFIITELTLEDAEGVEALSAILQAVSFTPVLVLTSQDDPALSLQAVQMGAQDYLVKGRGNATTFKRIILHSLERFRMLEQAHRNERMLNAFIQHAPAGIAVFDADMHLMMASDRWLGDHQLEEKTALGQHFCKLLVHADSKWPRLHHRCLQGEHITCEEDELTTNDGQVHYTRWEMMPWFDANGKASGVIQFAEFITQQRRIRRELEDARANLAEKVEERTSELVDAMLLAEEAQAAKEEFFANMTHELRTPLHAIINFSRFGKNRTGTVDNEKIVEYFTDIERSGRRLLGLVNDLLDLTKFQSKKMEIVKDWQDVSLLLEGVSKEMSAILETKALTLAVLQDPSVSTLYCDTRRLHQVLINLVSNAIKFSPSGSTIQMETQMLDSSSDILRRHALLEHEAYLLFSVLDQGMGIPEEELDSVFDEFAQSKKVKSGKFSAGTGLGLSICKQMVCAHGGQIWAENNSDGGAALYFVIPIISQME